MDRRRFLGLFAAAPLAAKAVAEVAAEPAVNWYAINTARMTPAGHYEAGTACWYNTATGEWRVSDGRGGWASKEPGTVYVAD